MKRNPSSALAQKPPSVSRVPAGAGPSPDLRAASAACSSWPSDGVRAGEASERAAQQDGREQVAHGEHELEVGDRLLGPGAIGR